VLGHLLDFFYDTVASVDFGEEEFTYDLSVPDNVTYVANGFVSHNTIGLMMDCDTTGVEPDLALTKAKKLVGGGTMFIVNQTIPRALRRLGYTDEQVDTIVGYIDEHKTIIGAPEFNPEHLPVFACSMGDNVIHYMGHVTMMGAVQPFISGAISKCVVGETLLTTGEGLVRIASLHRGEAADSFRDEVIEVGSLGGEQKTDAFYYGGLRPVREAVLRSGHRIVGTPNHRVLVAGGGQLEWMALEDLLPDEWVAVQYGAELWSTVPARFDDFVPGTTYGCQKLVNIPEEMTSELAFLLGASTLPFLYNVYVSSRSPQVGVDDPWGWGRSLEWATSSPPPRHNFVRLPRIRSESPAFDLHHPEIAALEMEHNEALRTEGTLADAPNVSGRRGHLEQMGGSVEGAAHGIKVNAVAPAAFTRMAGPGEATTLDASRLRPFPHPLGPAGAAQPPPRLRRLIFRTAASARGAHPAPLRCARRVPVPAHRCGPASRPAAAGCRRAGRGRRPPPRGSSARAGPGWG